MGQNALGPPLSDVAGELYLIEHGDYKRYVTDTAAD
jgi:hypothetical protein